MEVEEKGLQEVSIMNIPDAQILQQGAEAVRPLSLSLRFSPCLSLHLFLSLFLSLSLSLSLSLYLIIGLVEMCSAIFPLLLSSHFLLCIFHSLTLSFSLSPFPLPLLDPIQSNPLWSTHYRKGAFL